MARLSLGEGNNNKKGSLKEFNRKKNTFAVDLVFQLCS